MTRAPRGAVLVIHAGAIVVHAITVVHRIRFDRFVVIVPVRLAVVVAVIDVVDRIVPGTGLRAGTELGVAHETVVVAVHHFEVGAEVRVDLALVRADHAVTVGVQPAPGVALDDGRMIGGVLGTTGLHRRGRRRGTQGIVGDVAGGHARVDALLQHFLGIDLRRQGVLLVVLHGVVRHGVLLRVGVRLRALRGGQRCDQDGAEGHGQQAAVACVHAVLLCFVVVPTRVRGGGRICRTRCIDDDADRA